jgi:hypothetical protein
MKIIHYVAYRALFRTFWAIGLFFLASQVPRKHSVIVGIELCMWGVSGHVVSQWDIPEQTGMFLCATCTV